MGASCWASLRPESIRLTQSGGHEASVIASNFLGGSTRLALDVGSLRLHAIVPSVSVVPMVGEKVLIDWDRQDVHLMEEST